MNFYIRCQVDHVSVVIVGPSNDWIGLHDGHMDQVKVFRG